MATDPAFAVTPVQGAALLGNAETNTQVPTTTSIVLTAAATGTKIEEIVVEAAGTTLAPTTVAGLVYVFLYDGATYHLFDVIPVTAITASATVAPFRAARTYFNLVLKTGWSVRMSQSIAGNASLLKAHVFGADL